MDRGIVSGPGENCWNVYVNISKLRHRVDCSAKLLAEAVADNGLPGELLRRRSVGAEVSIANRAAHARQRRELRRSRVRIERCFQAVNAAVEQVEQRNRQISLRYTPPTIRHTPANTRAQGLERHRALRA